MKFHSVENWMHLTRIFVFPFDCFLNPQHLRLLFTNFNVPESKHFDEMSNWKLISKNADQQNVFGGGLVIAFHCDIIFLG